MAMFELKMNQDYSHLNSDNFDMFLSPHIGKLKDIFSKYNIFEISRLMRVFCL